MRIPKLAIAFFFLFCVALYVMYIKWHIEALPLTDSKDYLKLKNDPDNLCQPMSEEEDSRYFLYGIMFDAGSTGTRIHIFKFKQMPNDSPKLEHEIFKAIKPGLSAYADDPEKCTAGIEELLITAKQTIPCSRWKSTPLVLKATAGLRLLPDEKAEDLLNQVRNVFQKSPFLNKADCVSIMDGTDEGISAWITVNFLLGSLHGSQQRTVGMLDMGGGSTQITFSPQDEVTIQTSPVDYITSFQMFNNTHTLYSHSYLGLGLMSARLAILGGIEGHPLEEGEELQSPCLAPDYRGDWEHAEVVYTLRGQKAGEPIYESCYNKVEKMLYKKVKNAGEEKDLDFFAFSYYYDRAVDAGLIDERSGGVVKVEEYEMAAKKVCTSMETKPGEKPFLCLDLTYISVLLQELGFPKEKVFKLARKINDVETSWALGATFRYIESLQRQL
ncbi:ectonucleoside triphosphate diphosphohydrolase 6 [Polypterus senegalus]|uniref:ectonucleoside triphosphate diphosphohydrolase 6 n=1 Tax=Polypterus senegalus TaxID=55291 RepID=UPI0019624BD5|nr:ectonucleoside triphosphate diphosphohydrolase 6 [Polypterus senegalus]